MYVIHHTAYVKEIIFKFLKNTYVFGCAGS